MNMPTPIPEPVVPEPVVPEPAEGSKGWRVEGSNRRLHRQAQQPSKDRSDSWFDKLTNHRSTAKTRRRI